MGQKEHNSEENYHSEDVLTCQHCGSGTHEDVVKAAIWSEKGLIAIEDIPARVCEGCGEQFYDEETTQRIEKVVGDPAVKAQRQIVVPLFSLAEVEVAKRAGRPAVLDDEEMDCIESVFTGMEPAAEEMEHSQEPQETFLCTYCKSNTYEDVVKSALWTDKGLVAIEDIPARVCRECREQFYDDQTAGKIEKLIEQGFAREKATREVLAPLFSLAEVL